jgi:septal ring factor EnvC (AmiA/AmiB activator)
MDSWGVFGVIAALISFGVLVGAPLMKLNATITELKTVLDMLRKQFDKMCADNEKEHEAIWDKTEEQDKTLGDHETRISVLEHSKEA